MFFLIGTDYHGKERGRERKKKKKTKEVEVKKRLFQFLLLISVYNLFIYLLSCYFHDYCKEGVAFPWE